MSATSSEGYMGDRVFRDRPDSAIEQHHLDTAIAASLAPGQANSNGSSFGPLAVPVTTNRWATYSTQQATLRAAGTDTEDQNLLGALSSPTEDAQIGKANTAKSSEPQSSISEESQQPPGTNFKNPQSITEMIENMALRSATELPLLNSTDADTLVFIDPPPQQPAQDDYTYQQYIFRYTLPHHMRREKFFALKSPYFEKAFGPSNQHRVLRRRRLVKNLPEGIKYVLDLTPPMEGEDAVYLMTELCCSVGIRKWFQSAQRWNIAKRLVGGHDESQADHMLVSSHVLGSQKDKPSEAMKEDITEMLKDTDLERQANTGTSEANHTAESCASEVYESADIPASSTKRTTSIPLDYTALRHRSAIERVLHAAVEGLDPRIDSAPKLWTTFAVAKYFEVTHSSLTDYIVSWLRATPNSYFLEVLPEVSQKIADGLQCEDLCRDTFAILVGEEALANIWRGRNQAAGSPACTVYGRRREDLHEDYQTRIEYASKSFAERVISKFSALVDERMSWLDGVPAYSVLFTLEDGTNNAWTITQLKSMLKAYVRGRIYWVLCRDYKGLVGPIPDTRHIGSDLFPTASFTRTYTGLLPRERIFTRSFWKTLEQEDFSEGSANTYTNQDSVLAPVEGWTSSAKVMKAANLFEEVAKSRLTDMVGRLDDRHAQVDRSKGAKSGQAILPHSPDRSSGGDGTVQQLCDLSLSSPSKTKTNTKDDIADEEHDGKRRRLSGVLESCSTAKDEKYRSSNQLPFRLASMTPFSQEIVKLRERMPSFMDSVQRVSAKVAGAGDPKGTVTKLPIASKSPKCFFEPELIRIVASTRSNNQENQLGHIPERATFAIDSSPSRTVDDGHMQDTVILSAGNWRAWAAEKTSSAKSARSESLQDHDTPKPPSMKRILPKSYAPGFHLDTFLLQVNDKIGDVCAEMLAPPDFSTRSDALELALTDTLVCLVESEWKYLPLWAGGNDDGSGGVFDDSVPLAEAGVSAGAPGPGFHTGLSSAGSSEYELIGNSQDGSSSFHTSTVVNDGFSDQIDRRRVYDADSVWGDVMAKKDLGVGSTANTSKDKGRMEYADSEWSEVTAGREINDISFDKARIGEVDDMGIAQRLDGVAELLDDIWDEGEEEAFDSTPESDNDSDMVMI